MLSSHLKGFSHKWVMQKQSHFSFIIVLIKSGTRNFNQSTYRPVPKIPDSTLKDYSSSDCGVDQASTCVHKVGWRFHVYHLV